MKMYYQGTKMELTVGESIIAQVVCRGIEEDKDEGRDGSGMCLGRHKPLHGDCPSDVNAEHTTDTGEIRRSTFESRSCQRQCGGAQKSPAGDANVDFRFDDAVVDADQVEYVTQKVPKQ